MAAAVLRPDWVATKDDPVQNQVGEAGETVCSSADGVQAGYCVASLKR
jgi:hypothetical protein